VKTKRVQPVATLPPRPTTLAVDVARAVFGLHRRVRVGSVLYTERNSRSLERTLSEGGFKAYDVNFENAPAMRIRASISRPYPDLTGPEAVEPYHLLISHVLPGERVLDARCGSGYGAAVLADLVGPAGAVIAMDTDPEFIRYAKRRYPADHVGFELGKVDTLFGELDGSFDTTLLRLDASAVPTTSADPTLEVGMERAKDEPSELSILPELLRVTAPRGKLILLLKIPSDSFPSSGATPPAKANSSIETNAQAERSGPVEQSGPADTAGPREADQPAEEPDHPVIAHLKLLPSINSLCGVRKPGSDWAAIIAYKSSNP
jgi:SAM-dependent methyltransferase